MDHVIQQIQSAYRRRVVESFQIPAGSRVLEIGCGQGDMTVALAEAVGPDGHITAVDIANRSYGAPMTLGEATDLIKETDLGDRIEFQFEFDVLSAAWDEPFDYVVMVHCSWYFESEAKLSETLTHITTCGRNLCFAEWNTVPKSIEQVPHLMAVLIQGQVESLTTCSSANIRTPFSQTQIKRLLAKSEWNIGRVAPVNTAGLQDADWEISECLTNSLLQASELGLSARQMTQLAGQVDVLRQIAVAKGNVPLGALAIVASNLKLDS